MLTVFIQRLLCIRTTFFWDPFVLISMGDPEVSVLESEACFYFTSGFEEDGSEGGKGVPCCVRSTGPGGSQPRWLWVVTERVREMSEAGTLAHWRLSSLLCPPSRTTGSWCQACCWKKNLRADCSLQWLWFVVFVLVICCMIIPKLSGLGKQKVVLTSLGSSLSQQFDLRWEVGVLGLPCNSARTRRSDDLEETGVCVSYLCITITKIAERDFLEGREICFSLLYGHSQSKVKLLHSSGIWWGR